MMGFREIYCVYEEKIPKIAEVTKAERDFRKVYDQIAAYNTELADDVDMIAGMLARAYEAQGFNGGLSVARGAL